MRDSQSSICIATKLVRRKFVWIKRYIYLKVKTFIAYSNLLIVSIILSRKILPEFSKK